MTGSYTGTGAANTIGTVKEYLAGIADDVYKATAKTAGWAPDPLLVEGFQGAKSGYIADLDMDGLGTYSKSSGYPNGSVTLTWTEYTLANDRGRAFTLDNLDVLQSKGQAQASRVLSEFMRQKVVPEIDSLNIAAVAQSIIANQGVVSNHKGNRIEYNYTPAVGSFLSKLQAMIDAVTVRTDEEVVELYVNSAYKSILTQSSEVTKSRDVTNGVTRVGSTITEIDNARVIYVPEARMYAKYTVLDGVTDTKEAGGITPADAGGYKIAAFVRAPGSTMAINAYQVTKIFTPEENQMADGTKIAFRSYFDCLVPKNKLDGVELLVVDDNS
jgi:hypothetical protein